MSGDYTRFSFKREKRYSDLLQQQGRVALDSDWNEAFDIVRHRARNLALDTFGPLGVSSHVNPDSFKIGVVAGPDLSIHPGRAYVDGIPVELFDNETATYLHQPFYPVPPPLPAGNAVVYLDVWEREITYVQDPDLLDAALGGVDTTTRLQTVWQVKVASQANAKCGLPVGDPPSAGRMSTQAILPPAPDDPCILPPASGYRGLENELYRVEVQKPGAPGTATALWARGNASIVSAVRDIAVAGTRTTLTVDRIGRDQFLRFEIGNLVTVTDDWRELMGEPGDLATILDIDEFNNLIVIDIALPAAGGRAFGGNPAQIKARHTRVQRWDGQINIPNNTNPIPLELGIQVSFSTSGPGGFRTGDYWVFWARTATAEIETYTNAPPRGIVHYYAQLAAITGLPTPTKVSDCRPKELCCCTFVVDVNGDIQAAIDNLPPEGGCICLKAGVHVIPATLTLARDHVRIEGESPGAIVRIASASTVLAISGATGVRVCGVEFQAGATSSGVVSANMVTDGAIEDCVVKTADTASTAPASVGIRLSACAEFRIADTDIEGAGTGILTVAAKSGEHVFERNLVRRNTDDGHVTSPQVTTGILVTGPINPCRIEANVIVGVLQGIVVNDHPASNQAPSSAGRGAIVSRNAISCAVRSGETASEAPLVAIDVAADEAVVSMNRIASMGGAAHIGIRVTGQGHQVVDNQLSWSPQASAGGSHGVPGRIGFEVGYYSGGAGDNAVAPTADVRVRGNLIGGYTAGIVVAATIDTVVAENTIWIDPGANGVPAGVGILAYLTAGTLIEDNVVTNAALAVSSMAGIDNRISANTIANAGFGVTLVLEIAPAVDRNRIASASLFGIIAVSVGGRCDVIENRVDNCGLAGVAGFLVLGELHIEANEITDIGPQVSSAPPPPPTAVPGTPAAPPAPPPAYGIWAAGILEARVESNLVTVTALDRRRPTLEDRALWMMGLVDFALVYAPSGFTPITQHGGEGQHAAPRYEAGLGFAIQIVDNKFTGSGNSALVELEQIEFVNQTSDAHINFSVYARFARVIMCDNYCLHVTAPANAFPPDDGSMATVRLCGRAASVANNHVRGAALDTSLGTYVTLPGYYSFDFRPGVAPAGHMPGPFMGNVISGGVLDHDDFPAPQSAYNLTM
jgi:Family of unknown function (DUF6519)